MTNKAYAATFGCLILDDGYEFNCDKVLDEAMTGKYRLQV